MQTKASKMVSASSSSCAFSAALTPFIGAEPSISLSVGDSPSLRPLHVLDAVEVQGLAGLLEQLLAFVHLEAGTPFLSEDLDTDEVVRRLLT